MRMLRALLRRVVPGDWADDVVGELDEAYRRQRARRGRSLAAMWLIWQVGAFTLRFGGERIREALGAGWRHGLESAVGDLRLTLRSARRAPLFFIGVVLTLAVGIGANTAIFALVRTVLIDRLPYPDADRLVVLDPYPWIPVEALAGVQGRAAGLEALAGFYPHRFAATVAGIPAEIEGAVVTPDLLGLLGARVALGRAFTDADARPGAPASAVLSHEGWRRLFVGASDVLGRTVRLDGRPHEVIGVLVPGFRQLTPRTEDPAVWIPARMDRLSADILDQGSPPWAIPLARLSAGGAEPAHQALRAAAGRYVENDPEMAAAPRWRELRWTPLRAELVEDARTPLLMLQTAVGLVLLLACANVANLLLVRSSSRRAEMALRSALGASRPRVLGQLVTEGVVLALLGGTVGLAVAALTLDLLVGLAPPGIPRLDGVRVDALTVSFTVGVAVALGVVLGLVPGLSGSGWSPATSLKEGARANIGSRRRHTLSRALVVGEISLTLVLLVGAGLLVRSFLELRGEDPGFRVEDVIAVPLTADRSRYGELAALTEYQRDLLAQVASVPGVESVALANNLPHRRAGASRSIIVEGRSEPQEAQYAVVSADYFGVLEIPVERGRPLRESDAPDAPGVAVVDRALADHLWPDEDPLGNRFRLEEGDRWWTVVGVSAGVRGGGLRAAPAPGFHISYQQRPDDAVEVAVGRDMTLLVRIRRGTDGSHGQLLRRAVWEVDPEQPVPEVRALDEILAESTRGDRFQALLVGTFAVLAVILALIGIYGVIAQIVGERRHELGVRKALGATNADLIGDVLAWGVWVTGLGLAIGIAAVLFLAPLLGGMLHGVRPTDPATVAAAAGTVLLMSLAACLVPALRAARADARVILTEE